MRAQVGQVADIKLTQNGQGCSHADHRNTENDRDAEKGQQIINNIMIVKLIIQAAVQR